MDNARDHLEAPPTRATATPSHHDYGPLPAIDPKIPLAKMPHQAGVRGVDDDWAGVNNPAERRKLQNRLNARLFRKRRGAKQTHADTAVPPGSVSRILKPRMSVSRDAAHNNDSKTHTSVISDQNGVNISTTSISRHGTFCGLPLWKAQEIIHEYEKDAYEAYALGSPKVDQLLTLIQFNVSRALISNTMRLGFPMDWLTSCDCTSPFNNEVSGFPDQSYESCPSSLRPTELQRRVTHHPWFDFFPFPAMRDNILRQGEDFEDGLLCLQLVEFCDVPHERTGLIVWGEPWDPSAWEVSEAFLESSGWVLKGCWELLRSTNRWREQRGETPLVFGID